MTALLVGNAGWTDEVEPLTMQEAADAQAKLDAFVTASGLGKASILCESTPPYRILGANSTWTQLCGFSKAEAVGKTTKILHGEQTDTEKAASFASELHRTGKARSVLVNYDASRAPFVHSLRATRVRSGGDSYYLVQGEKVTDAAVANAVSDRSRDLVERRRNRSTLQTVFFTAAFGTMMALATQDKLFTAAVDPLAAPPRLRSKIFRFGSGALGEFDLQIAMEFAGPPRGAAIPIASAVKPASAPEDLSDLGAEDEVKVFALLATGVVASSLIAYQVASAKGGARNLRASLATALNLSCWVFVAVLLLQVSRDAHFRVDFDGVDFDATTVAHATVSLNDLFPEVPCFM